MSVKWMGWNGMDMREALRAGRKVLIPLKAPSDRKCARSSRSTPGCLDVHTHSRRFPGSGDSRLNDRTRKSLSLRRWLCRVKDVAPQFGRAKRCGQDNTKPVETRHLQTSTNAKPRTSADPCVRQVAGLQQPADIHFQHIVSPSHHRGFD